MQALHLRIWRRGAGRRSGAGQRGLGPGRCGARASTCPTVGTGSARRQPGGRTVRRPLPLVLDRGALYLQRLWRAETTLAHVVRTLDTEVPFACGGGVTRGRRRVRPRDPDDPQQRAVAADSSAAHGNRAGHGQDDYARASAGRLRSRRPQAHRLCSAHRRSRRGSRSRWPRSCPASIPRASCAAPGRKGQTVHRLRRARARAATPRSRTARSRPRDRRRASMLDIELAARLLESLPRRQAGARRRSGPARGRGGAVFADLCAAPLAGDRARAQLSAAGCPRHAALAAGIRRLAAGHGGRTRGGVMDSVAGARRRDRPARHDRAGAAHGAADRRQALAAWRDALRRSNRGGAQQVLAARPPSVLAAMREGQSTRSTASARVRRLATGSAYEDWYAGRPDGYEERTRARAVQWRVGVCRTPSVAQATSTSSWRSTARGRAPVPGPSDACLPGCLGHDGAQVAGFGFDLSLALAPPATRSTPANSSTGRRPCASALSVWGTREVIDEAARLPRSATAGWPSGWSACRRR